MTLGPALRHVLDRHATALFGLPGLFSSASGGGSELEFREYYAAGCPHCQHLDPAWKEAAGKYHGPVHFRQVECADENWAPVPGNEALCEGIQAFPTMGLYKGSKKLAAYDGERSAGALLDFARQHESAAERAVPLPLALLPAPASRRPRAPRCPGGDFL